MKVLKVSRFETIMAEFGFYCVAEDWRPLLEAVVREHRLSLVIDAWYPSATPPVHASMTDQMIQQIVKEKRRVFLFLPPDPAPVVLDRQDEGPAAGLYSVDQLRSGPMLDLSLPASYRHKGVLRLGPGVLAYHSAHWNQDLTEAYPASPELKATYGAVKQTIRRLLVRAMVTKPIWISRLALDQLQQGRAEVIIAGKWIRLK
jgi:hypothetical protein